MRNHFKAVRTMAVFLSVAVTGQHLAFAAPLSTPGVSPANPMPSVAFVLPESVATIEDGFVGSSGKTLILLQDPHTNESGQINEAKALSEILSKEGIRHLFAEGAQGDVSLSYFKSVFKAEDIQSVAMASLRKGQVKGPEYLSLVSDLDFVIWGVEDPGLYDEAVLTYQAVVDRRDAALAYLDRASRVAQTLKESVYSTDLKALDDARLSHEKGEKSMADYYGFLFQSAEKSGVYLGNYRHLTVFKQLKKAESEIDFEAVQTEQQTAIRSLSASDRAELQSAQAPASLFKFSDDAQDPRKAFAALLEEKLAASGTGSDYPELKKYFRYLSGFKELSAPEILEEMASLESEVTGRLARTTDERYLVAFSRYLELLQKMLNLKITPDQFQALAAAPDVAEIRTITGYLNKKISDLNLHHDQAVMLDDAFEAAAADAKKFYELAYRRDQVFVDEALAKMEADGVSKAVMYTGGYHASNLKELLKRSGVSYVSVMPQVLHETDSDRYERLLLKQVASIEKKRKLAKSQTENSVLSAVITEWVGTTDGNVRSLAGRIQAAFPNAYAPDSVERVLTQRGNAASSVRGMTTRERDRDQSLVSVMTAAHEARLQASGSRLAMSRRAALGVIAATTVFPLDGLAQELQRSVRPLSSGSQIHVSDAGQDWRHQDLAQPRVKRVDYTMYPHKRFQVAPKGGLGTGLVSRNFLGQSDRVMFSDAVMDENLTGTQVSVFSKPVTGGKGSAIPLGKRGDKDTRLSSWNWNEGSSVAEAATYRALFPFSLWNYPSGKSDPVRVAVREHSPFTKDLAVASLPVAFTEVELENTTDAEVETSVMLSAENFTGWGLQERPAGTDDEKFYDFVKTSDGQNSAFRREAGVAGLTMGSSKPKDRRLAGQLAIVAEQTAGMELTYHSAFDVQGTGEEVWKGFASTGKLSNSNARPAGNENAGAIAVKVTLKPGEKRVVRFATAWDIPHDIQGSTTNAKYYTRQYGETGQNAFQIAKDALQNRAKWEADIHGWQKQILDNPNLDADTKRSMINELYYLVDGGSFLDKNGTFVELEGIDYRIHGTLDVFFYSSMLTAFFPELEKSFMRLHASVVDVPDNTPVPWWNKYPVEAAVPNETADLTDEQKKNLETSVQLLTRAMADPNASFPYIDKYFKEFPPKFYGPRHGYRSPHSKAKAGASHHLTGINVASNPFKDGPVGGGAGRYAGGHFWQNHNVWKDLNPKFVLMAWRAYVMDLRQNGDKPENLVFLKEMWPKVVAALEYQKRFMRRADGTQDVLPLHAGIPDQTYDTWSMKGAATYTSILTLEALEAALKIGELVGDESHAEEYRDWLDQGKKAVQERLWNAEGGYFNIDEDEAHKTDIMADAMAGIQYAMMYDLPLVVDQKQVESHLRRVYESNFKSVAGGKLGIINGVPADPAKAVQKDGDIQKLEVWVGVQRSVASLMVMLGMDREAEEILAVDYQKTWRNGFQFQVPEAYDGDNKFRTLLYGRAGAIWSVLEARNVRAKAEGGARMSQAKQVVRWMKDHVNAFIKADRRMNYSTISFRFEITDQETNEDNFEVRVENWGGTQVGSTHHYSIRADKPVNVKALVDSIYAALQPSSLPDSQKQTLKREWGELTSGAVHEFSPESEKPFDENMSARARSFLESRRIFSLDSLYLIENVSASDITDTAGGSKILDEIRALANAHQFHLLGEHPRLLSEEPFSELAEALKWLDGRVAGFVRADFSLPYSTMAYFSFDITDQETNGKNFVVRDKKSDGIEISTTRQYSIRQDQPLNVKALLDSIYDTIADYDLSYFEKRTIKSQWRELEAEVIHRFSKLSGARMAVSTMISKELSEAFVRVGTEQIHAFLKGLLPSIAQLLGKSTEELLQEDETVVKNFLEDLAIKIAAKKPMIHQHTGVYAEVLSKDLADLKTELQTDRLPYGDLFGVEGLFFGAFEFAKRPESYSREALLDPKNIKRNIRIEVRGQRADGTAGQVAVIGIPGVYRNTVMNQFAAIPGADVYGMRAGGFMTIEVNVSKDVAVQFIARNPERFREILRRSGYKPGLIDALQTGDIILTDLDGTLLTAPKLGQDPTLAQSSTQASLNEYLKMGGVVVAISANGTDLQRERLREGMDPEAASNLFVIADGSAVMSTMDGTVISEYEENALGEFDKSYQLADANLVYLGDNHDMAKGNDAEAFRAVGGDRAISVAPVALEKVPDYLKPLHIGRSTDGTDAFLKQVIRFAREKNNPSALLFTPQNIARLVEASRSEEGSRLALATDVQRIDKDPTLTERDIRVLEAFAVNVFLAQESQDQNLRFAFTWAEEGGIRRSIIRAQVTGEQGDKQLELYAEGESEPLLQADYQRALQSSRDVSVAAAADRLRESVAGYAEDLRDAAAASDARRGDAEFIADMQLHIVVTDFGRLQDFGSVKGNRLQNLVKGNTDLPQEVFDFAHGKAFGSKGHYYIYQETLPESVKGSWEAFADKNSAWFHLIYPAGHPKAGDNVYPPDPRAEPVVELVPAVDESAAQAVQVNANGAFQIGMAPATEQAMPRWLGAILTAYSIVESARRVSDLEPDQTADIAQAVAEMDQLDAGIYAKIKDKFNGSPSNADLTRLVKKQAVFTLKNSFKWLPMSVDRALQVIHRAISAVRMAA